jgi:hypothetical protein
LTGRPDALARRPAAVRWSSRSSGGTGWPLQPGISRQRFAGLMSSNQFRARNGQPIDEQDVRLTAYFLWEQDGYPEGRAQEYWHRAWAQHRRMAEYDEALGAPIDVGADGTTDAPD